MQWRITVEAVDQTGEEYRQKFLFDKSLDSLTDGRIGCSIDDGKVIMAEIQKAVVQRELDLWVRYRRVCQCCEGLHPIKDYQERKILTVFGAVPVTYPRLTICQRCNPWACFTFSPAADLCPDRATPELMELSARLGAKLSYRDASDILSTFLPCHLSRKFTTLRHRTLSVGKRIERAERDRLLHERLDHEDPIQLELPLESDPAREVVFTVDTAHIPLVRHWGGRTFEAVVGHCGRGGWGDSAGPVFAFEGTQSAELKATATLVLADQGYAGRGEITVISDGEECLKRLAGMLPQPTIHILDWFHISTKLQPLAQMAATAPNEHLSFEQDIDRIKWRLWNGHPKRALKLITSVRTQLSSAKDYCLWARRADKLLEKLNTYISRNRGSITNYAERYRAQKRIATSPAEANVNALVAERFVKKQQMRWSRNRAHYLLKVRAAMLNDDLSERTRYVPPETEGLSRVASLMKPTLPLLQAA
jgi:hypothetical protein